MNRLKSAIIAIGLALALVLALPALASAVNPYEEVCAGKGSGSVVCGAPTNDPIAGTNGVISRIVNILSVVVGVVSVIFIIMGGIKYITSNGDSSAVSTAKSTIIYALIGLLVAFMAQPLIRFVLTRI